MSVHWRWQVAMIVEVSDAMRWWWTMRQTNDIDEVLIEMMMNLA
jgi:hypothetical protein